MKIKWFRSFGLWIEWVEHHGLLILALLLTVTSGLWFFTLDGSVLSRIPRSLYYSLQFIWFNRDIDYAKGGLLRYGLVVTQFAIPLFAYFTFFSALFRDRIVPFLNAQEAGLQENHHVIIGYGAFGQALAKELGENGKRVVGIDLLGSPKIFETKPKSSVKEPILLRYDALHDPIVKIANMESAACVYLLLPKERDNLSILENITGNLKNNSQVFIRTETSDLQRLLADWVGIKAFRANPTLDIRSCSPIDIAARGIVNAYAPDIYTPTDTKGPIAQTVMVTGTSAAAKALVLRFARIGVYSPKGKLQLVWAGDGVGNAYSELVADYPALATNYHHRKTWGAPPGITQNYFDCVLPPIQVTFLDSPAAQAIRNGSITHICGTRYPAVIYVCHDSNIRNLAEARDLQAALCSHELSIDIKDERQRLILAVQSRSLVSIGDDTDVPALKVLPYCIKEVCLDSLFAKTVAEDRADELAKGFHAAYAERQKIDDGAWEQERFFIKESNRDVADHLAIKARYAGIPANRVADCVFQGAINISDSDRELMASVYQDLVKMEELRYRAFMFMNGFTHGSHPAKYHLNPQQDNDSQMKLKKELDRCLRLNSTLLTEILPQNEQDKDNDIIKLSLQALHLRIAQKTED